MKNKLSDLNDHLFLQLERLNDETIKGEDLKTEIERGKAIAEVSAQIVGAAKVTVDSMKLIGRGDITKDDLPLLLKNKQ